MVREVEGNSRKKNKFAFQVEENVSPSETTYNKDYICYATLDYSCLHKIISFVFLHIDKNCLQHSFN